MIAGYPVWYELLVPDVDAVEPLYRAVLGWTIAEAPMDVPTGIPYRMITRADGGGAGIAGPIPPEMASQGTKPAWYPYFTVADVDAAVAKARELGASIWVESLEVPGAGRMAMLSDPQGATFYVITPTPPENDPEAKSTAFDVNLAGHCRWNELNTNDGPAADGFYKVLFGWNTDDGMPMGDLGTYQFINVDQVVIGAVCPIVPEGMAPHWLPYFGVDNIDDAEALVKQSGGTITHPITEVPGGDFIFTALDAGGAHVGFTGPKGV